MAWNHTVSPAHSGVDEARSYVRDLARRINEVIDACTASWAAAHMYEELSRLPDRELTRQGLSRDMLGTHCWEACHRQSEQRPSTRRLGNRELDGQEIVVVTTWERVD